MNTGLQDAHNIAWKLAMVIKGHADKKLLSTYESGAPQDICVLLSFFIDLSERQRCRMAQHGQRVPVFCL
jgi:2-polyprenyl-6-methoxyphenol hydroxylase-like FAD-dependent oxidoreductase